MMYAEQLCEYGGAYRRVGSRKIHYRGSEDDPAGSISEIPLIVVEQDHNVDQYIVRIIFKISSGWFE